ncbi:MAG: phytanoyl-CoA dioxygenase family protein [Abditibacteriales bacterium]|nr:phytanoyl-CoA dioxygenase family protein [Abditibacteriales bacterium]
MRLTEAQKRFYAENGFLAVENVVPAERMAAMRQRIEELCARWDSAEARRVGVQQEAEIAGAMTRDKTAQTVRKFSNLVPYEPVFKAHATDPDLLDMVEDLIGTPLSLYADQALLKPPFVGSEKMPHQDNAYFRVVPDSAVITCWCALDDATVENGCMHYMPGTHRWGVVEHEHVPGTPHLVPKGYDPAKAVAVPIKAGGVIFHHSCTLHHSPANNTPHWRRAFVCHFVRSDAEMPARPADSPPLLRLR